MTTTTPASRDTVGLSEIVAGIWATMLELDLEPVPQEPNRSGGVRVTTGCVQITGHREVAVILECSTHLARTAAALLFDLPADDLTDEEVLDTVGELANVAGGQVKSRLGGDCAISLPSVTEGVDYRVLIPGSRLLERAVFDCAGQRVVASMLVRTGQPGTSTSR